MIKLANLTKIYRSNRKTIKVLDNVNLHFKAGERICLKGDSGSGKTTLLNIIGGMLAPTSGTVEVNGFSLTTMPQHFLSSYRRNNIGFIFQQFNLLPDFTILENLLFPTIPAGRPIKESKRKIERLLDRLQIGQRINSYVNELSGGEQQRIAVARALVNDPEIIIADEPFSNLDQKNTEFILDLFKELNTQNKTFLIASHSRYFDLENQFIDREVFINDYQ